MAVGSMKWFGGALAAAVFLAVPAAAFDLMRQRDVMPPRWVAEHAKMAELADILAPDEASKGAFVPIYQWPAAVKKLRVCFYEGGDEVKQAIRDIASEWEAGDNSIRFDWGKNGFRTCGSGDPARVIHIRIGFRQPGYHSWLGTQSVMDDKVNDYSMNLQDYDKLSPDEIRTGGGGWYAGTVRHEFGHALGLLHEHQSPKATCEDEYDWETLYTEFGKPPASWDRATVEMWMKRWVNPDTVSTKFDPLSVMKYYLDASLFKKGKEAVCYSEGDNNSISELDRKTIAYMYPANEQARIARYEADKAAFQALTKRAQDAGAKGVLMDLITALIDAATRATLSDDVED